MDKPRLLDFTTQVDIRVLKNSSSLCCHWSNKIFDLYVVKVRIKMAVPESEPDLDLVDPSTCPEHEQFHHEKSSLFYSLIEDTPCGLSRRSPASSKFEIHVSTCFD